MFSIDIKLKSLQKTNKQIQKAKQTRTKIQPTLPTHQVWLKTEVKVKM